MYLVSGVDFETPRIRISSYIRIRFLMVSEGLLPYVAGGWCWKALFNAGLDGVGRPSDTIHWLPMVSEDLPKSDSDA